ncbi:MAG TPA: hypothetical protein VMF65_02520 [Acidimicrobiales bacterium]|nr:hypothetical protein [Acidimicrobiales bacterium]
MKHLKFSTKSGGAALAAAAAAVIVPLTLVQVTPAGAASAKPQQQREGGSVTIQSWVYTPLSENDLSATAWSCSEISGAIVDQSGDPTWTSDAQYAAPTKMSGAAGVAAAAAECGNKVPAGGIVIVPPPEPGQYIVGPYDATPGASSADQYTGLSSLYSYQTILAQKGTIFLTIASTYNLTDNPVKVGDVTVAPFTTGPQATWTITGGTGEYAGLQGDGTWDGDASTIPWCYRLATGKVWYVNSNGGAS